MNAPIETRTHDARGVVCAGHPAVAEAGAELLERGGNAIDAAVGAFFTAFHAEPMLSSAAGGGFLVAEVDGEAVAYDFFAAAPGLGNGAVPYQPRNGAFWAVQIDFGAATQQFHIGPGSVAVPGALAGLCEVQRDLGRLGLGEVLEPAIRACEGGITLSEMGGLVLRLLEPIVRATAELAGHLVHDDGSLYGAGQLLLNPELARFYEVLANAGSHRPLYDGELSRLLVETIAGQGGGLTAQDLASYRVHRTAPVRRTVAGGTAELLLAPPPSSGGILIAYGMALLDTAPPVASGSVAEVLLLRAVMAEMSRARAEIIGASTPHADHADALLDDAYVAGGCRRLAGLLECGSAPIDRVPEASGAGNTTHVSVIDGRGNACAVTLSAGEGSGAVLPGYGVLFNNFLGEEDLNPLGFHRFVPGARLGSSMTPSLLVTRDGRGRGVAAMGSGGSNRIRTALLQVMHRLVRQGVSPEVAVSADRVHYEGGVLYGEAQGTLAAALETLRRQGVRLSRFERHHMFFGGVHLASRGPAGEFHGVGDARRNGAMRLVHGRHRGPQV